MPQASYQTWINAPDLVALQQKNQERLTTNSAFKEIKDKTNILADNRKTSRSLEIQKYKAQQKEVKEISTKVRNLTQLKDDFYKDLCTKNMQEVNETKDTFEDCYKVIEEEGKYDMNIINSFWYNPPQFNFKSEYVNSKNIYKHIQENNHLDDKNMILKMDIEACEYETLINCQDEVFDHFSQIILELHDVVNECNDRDNILNVDDTEARWANKINLLTRLNRYYYLVHIHGNNWIKTKSEGLCDVLELTFIRKDKFIDKLELSNVPCPVPGLDFKCCNCDWHSTEDVVLDWWVK
jgi:hypothetical protein